MLKQAMATLRAQQEKILNPLIQQMNERSFDL